MKQRLVDSRQGLHVIAAAVLVALGASPAVAQQAGQQEADRPLTQQSQRDPLSSQRESERPASQSESQDSASSRLGQDSAESRLGQDSSDRAGQAASEQESETRSAAADTGSAGGSGQLDQIAQEHEDLSTFVEAVKAAGMEESLTGGTAYTVFAPTNEAWEQMSGLSTEELMRPENREQLVSLLRAHIVADDVDETLARSLPQAQTIDGGTVDISASGDELQVGDASVVESGIQQGSLRVYAIDQVLEPTALARADTSSESGLDSDSGAESESDSGSVLDSERDSGSVLDTESERESPLDTGSERDSGSLFERDDAAGGLDHPGAGQSPGADQPGAPSTDRSGSQLEQNRSGSQN